MEKLSTYNNNSYTIYPWKRSEYDINPDEQKSFCKILFVGFGGVDKLNKGKKKKFPCSEELCPSDPPSLPMYDPIQFFFIIYINDYMNYMIIDLH